MKKLLLLALLAMGGLQSASANYWYNKPTGGSPATFNGYPQTATTILKNSSSKVTINDTLSKPVTLPFTFNFFGKPYTQFKVSDNGYITFDLNETKSVPANTTLPSATAPKAAIFAYWNDLAFQPIVANGSTYPSMIGTYTTGTAPNRSQIISWFQLSEKGKTAVNNLYLFSIVLYEQGGFDIVHWGGWSEDGNLATIGAQNEDGTIGISSAGSPNENIYPKAANGLVNADGSDDIIWKFYEGVQKDRDLLISSASFPKTSTVGKPVFTVPVEFSSLGKVKVDSVKVMYQIDNSAPIAKVIKKTITTGTTATLNVSVDATGIAAGKFFNLAIWHTDINGAADENTSNDNKVNANIFVNNGVSAHKKVLLEEGTGAWCGYCPRGAITLRDILNSDTNVVGLGLHNNDGMNEVETVNDLDTLMGSYFSTYPTGMVDRSYVKAAKKIAIDDSYWNGAISQRANLITPADIKITSQIDANTRILTAKVDVKFLDYAAGDFRINAFVVEDSLRGPDEHNTWTQHNYYAGSQGVPEELSNAPEWIVGMVYRNVVKSIPTGVTGLKGRFNALVLPNDTASFSFTYTLPEQVDVTYDDETINDGLAYTAAGPGYNKINKMKIVAYVTSMGSTLANSEVINVEMVNVKVVNGSNVNDNVEATNNTVVYPNPADNVINISGKENIDLNYTLINLLGEVVATGVNSNNKIDINNLNSGCYYIQINGATHKFVKK